MVKCKAFKIVKVSLSQGNILANRLISFNQVSLDGSYFIGNNLTQLMFQRIHLEYCIVIIKKVSLKQGTIEYVWAPPKEQ